MFARSARGGGGGGRRRRRRRRARRRRRPGGGASRHRRLCRIASSRALASDAGPAAALGREHRRRTPSRRAARRRGRRARRAAARARRSARRRRARARAGATPSRASRARRPCASQKRELGADRREVRAVVEQLDRVRLAAKFDRHELVRDCQGHEQQPSSRGAHHKAGTIRQAQGRARQRAGTVGSCLRISAWGSQASESALIGRFEAGGASSVGQRFSPAQSVARVARRRHGRERVLAATDHDRLEPRARVQGRGAGGARARARTSGPLAPERAPVSSVRPRRPSRTSRSAS